MPTTSSALITKESQAMPYLGLQQNRNSNSVHHNENINSTGKDSISELFFFFLLFFFLIVHSLELTVTDRADTKQLGWIDLSMKTTTNSHQTSHISYITYLHYGTLQRKFTCIPLTKKIHKTNMQISTTTSLAAPPLL